MRNRKYNTEPYLGGDWDEVLKMALVESVRSEWNALEKAPEVPGGEGFSERFLRRMEKILPMAERKYATLGKRTIRRSALIAAILILVMAASAAVIAVTVPQIHYLIFKSNISWDILFQQEDPNDMTEQGVQPIRPNFPNGFEIVEEEVNTDDYDILAVDSVGNRIIYNQHIAEGAGSTINAEGESIREEWIDGHRFVISENDPTSVILFDNGYYIFTIAGDCDVRMLIEMGREVLKE